MLRAVLHVLVLAPAQVIFCAAALGQADLSLYLGAGEPGTRGFELGVGITSLIKVRLLPTDGIDLTLVETAPAGTIGDFLITDQAEIIALTGLEPITRSSRADLRSVMTFKPSNIGAGPSLELVARTDVAEDAVYLIAKVILENGVFLEDLNKGSWDLSADQALLGLTLDLHPGAVRYYEEIGEANLPRGLANLGTEGAGSRRGGSQDYSTFFVNFGAEATALDQNAEKLIAEACQYANIFEAEQIKVAGPSKDSGDGEHPLVTERVRLVAAALRANTSCAANIEIASADQVDIALPEGVSAAVDDQIKVIIILP